MKKFSNGKYLLWYHNHGGEAVHAAKWDYYFNRNPAWVAGGIEKDGHIYWSEPEILLYDENPDTRMSYPDFIEDHGEFYVTETQKTLARIHHIDRTLLDGVWNQRENKSLATNGLVLDVDGTTGIAEMPKLASMDGGGFSIDFWVKFRELSPGQIILDARDGSGKGFALSSTDRSTLQIVMNDGKVKAAWDSDPGRRPAR